MRIPRLLYVVPIVAAGLFAPGLTSATTLPHHPHIVGMIQENFSRSHITLHTGDRLEFDNNSNFLHVITLGHQGRIEREPGAPIFGGRSWLVTMWRGRVYTTPPWDTPGVYHVTCTLHTGMNLTVVVVGQKVTARAPGTGGGP